ncbi:Protein phosphatase 2C 7 [Yamadazyma tenuis]|nr:Protein phosphatase 2C 7 [Yamadazyma tenuis]
MIGLMISSVAKRGIPHVLSKSSTLPISFLSLNSRRCFSFSSSYWNLNNDAKSSASSEHTSAGNIGSDDLFSIAFAYQPKDREESNVFKRKNKKLSPALESPTGEDNLFVSAFKDGSVAVGVADGVGGWSEAGYDSSAISRELCNFIQHNFEASPHTSPKDLLIKSFADVLQSPKVEIGGTTACLGVFSNDYTVKVANLGDSWCGLFRDYKLVNETNFQTHNFNTPFQLAKIPQHVLRQAEMAGKRYIVDKPEFADEYTWKLQKDDVVIFATDGVTDNIIPQDIEIFLKDRFESGLSQEDITKSFVKEVVSVSKNPNFPSAFAQELSRLTGQKYLGGKEDDITVVLVKVL